MGQVYVASISAMISLYMRNAQLDHMLNAQEASVIFSNAEEILSINTKLLGKLQAKGEPIAKLARVFLEVGPNPTPNPNLNPYLNPNPTALTRWLSHLYQTEQAIARGDRARAGGLG